jgi:hypothetical protein
MNQTPKFYKKYEYRSGLWMPLLAIVTFGGSSLIIFHMAQLAETQPVIFMHLITVPPPWGSYILYLLSLLSAGFIFMGLAALYTRFFWPIQYLEISEYSVRIPKLYLSKEKEVFFKDVLSVEETEVSGTKSLKLKTPFGVGVITNRLLKSEKIYEEIRDAVRSQLNVTKQ